MLLLDTMARGTETHQLAIKLFTFRSMKQIPVMEEMQSKECFRLLMIKKGLTMIKLKTFCGMDEVGEKRDLLQNGEMGLDQLMLNLINWEGFWFRVMEAEEDEVMLGAWLLW